MDDLLRLAFTYTVTDLDGDSVTGSFNIDVMDDAPTFGEAQNGSVDEDYLGNGNPNEEGDGEGDGEEGSDDLPPELEQARTLEAAVPSTGPTRRVRSASTGVRTMAMPRVIPA